VALFRHCTPELSRGGPKKGPTFVGAPDLFFAAHRGLSANREIFDLHAGVVGPKPKKADLRSFDFTGRSATGCARRPVGTFLGNPLLTCTVLVARCPTVAGVRGRPNGSAAGAQETAEFAGDSHESPVWARPSAHVSASPKGVPLYFSE